MDNDEEEIVRGSSASREQKRKFSRKTPLRLEIFRASSKAEPSSPESEDDILSVLDVTPDVQDGLSKLGQRSISYSRVYDLKKFSEIMPHAFIRDQQMVLSVIKVEHLSGPISFLNQHVLTILLQHGDCQWIITRKMRQLTSLHRQLHYFKAMLRVPAATAQGRERRQSMRGQIKNDDELQSARKIVKFPRREIQRMDANAKQAIETYMRNLLHHTFWRSHHAVLEFFEISPLSFVLSLGTKLKEGYVKKKSHTNSTFIAQCLGRFKTMWLILKESYLFVVCPSNGQIRTVMLMDAAFQVSHGFRHTGITRGLRVTNLSRSLLLRCDGEESEKEWASSIEDVKNTHGDDFVKENRFSSFAPVRRHSKARWYVDGYSYMKDVADMLESAKEEIFITDWWLSPDIYLIRPDHTGKYWMLSEVLKRQAERGVKIFILLYKELELALELDSLYSKHSLSKLSTNIKVLRHPDHLKNGPSYWAHHEKIVVIDQMYAFVGGIDLCYGRWDNHQHKLADIGHGGRKFKRPTSLGLAQLVQGSRNMFSAGVLGEATFTSPTERNVTDNKSGVNKSLFSSNAECERKESGIAGADMEAVNGDSVDNQSSIMRAVSFLPASRGFPDIVKRNNGLPLVKKSIPHHSSISENHLLVSDSQLSDDSDYNEDVQNNLDFKSNWNFKTTAIELLKKKRAKSVISKAKEKIYRSSSADSEFYCQLDSDDGSRDRANRRIRDQRKGRGRLPPLKTLSVIMVLCKSLLCYSRHSSASISLHIFAV